MNSVTMVKKLRMNRSPTEKAPQNLPKRSLMRRAWPTPVTAPSRTTISWLTISTGIRSGRVHSRREPEVLPGLRVRRDAAGVVVADHDDEAGPDDRGQREQARAIHRPACTGVTDADRAEGTLDVADVRLVEDGGPAVSGCMVATGHARSTSRGFGFGGRCSLVAHVRGRPVRITGPCGSPRQRRAPSSFRRTFIGAQGFSLVVPKLQSAWVESVGHGPPRRTPRRTPLVRALAPAAVGPRASHFGRSLVPGKSVLTRSVFRQVGSVACVRRAASPNEVRLLAPGCYPRGAGHSRVDSGPGRVCRSGIPAEARREPRIVKRTPKKGDSAQRAWQVVQEANGQAEIDPYRANDPAAVELGGLVARRVGRRGLRSQLRRRVQLPPGEPPQRAGTVSPPDPDRAVPPADRTNRRSADAFCSLERLATRLEGARWRRSNGLSFRPSGQGLRCRQEP